MEKKHISTDHRGTANDSILKTPNSKKRKFYQNFENAPRKSVVKVVKQNCWKEKPINSVFPQRIVPPYGIPSYAISLMDYTQYFCEEKESYQNQKSIEKKEMNDLIIIPNHHDIEFNLQKKKYILQTLRKRKQEEYKYKAELSLFNSNITWK